MTRAVYAGSCHSTRTITFGISAYKYPWLQERLLEPRLEGDVRPIAKDYLLKDYLADAQAERGQIRARRDRMGSSNPVGETEWLQGIADSMAFPWDRRACDVGCADEQFWKVTPGTRTCAEFAMP